MAAGGYLGGELSLIFELSPVTGLITALDDAISIHISSSTGAFSKLCNLRMRYQKTTAQSFNDAGRIKLLP